jgi:hypothetical protein
MPHVVFDISIDLVKLQEEFQKIFLKNSSIIKIEDIFVDKNSTSALLPTIVVEEKNQNFFIQILTNSKKTTIRLFPLTDPEKTSGVKTSLGLVAKMIQTIFVNPKISKTNISEFIE